MTRILGLVVAGALLLTAGIWASASFGTDEEGGTAQPPVNSDLVGEEQLVDWMNSSSSAGEGSPIIAPAHGDSPPEVIFCPDGEPLLIHSQGEVRKAATSEGFDPTDPDAEPPGDNEIPPPECSDGSTPDLYLEMVARGD